MRWHDKFPSRGSSKVCINATENQNRPSKYAVVLSLEVGGTRGVDGATPRAGGR